MSSVEEIVQRRNRLLSLIERGFKGNTEQLAKKLGVSERTINRDIQALKKNHPTIRYDITRGGFTLK